jgi:glycosyltransferase involved in cell wall biosynthesis
LLHGVETIDHAVQRAFEPEQRLAWEAVGDQLPPRSTLVGAPGSVVCIIPHYRCERWLGRALHSIVNQTRRPERIVVACDAGEIPPLNLMEAFPAVTFVASHERAGPYALTQAVIDRTDEDWILCQDADDWSSIDRLERQLDHAQRTGAIFMGADLVRVDERTSWCQPMLHPHISTDLALRDGDYALAHPACLVHRSLVEQLGGFATDLFISGDMDFASRAAFVTDIHNTPAGLVYYLIRESSLTHASNTSPRSRLNRDIAKRIAERVRRNHAAVQQGSHVDLTPLGRRASSLDLSHVHGPCLASTRRSR